jgi:hypothetical protein
MVRPCEVLTPFALGLSKGQCTPTSQLERFRIGSNQSAILPDGFKANIRSIISIIPMNTFSQPIGFCLCFLNSIA